MGKAAAYWSPECLQGTGQTGKGMASGQMGRGTPGDEEGSTTAEQRLRCRP